MPVSERTYESVTIEDPDGRWELHHGRLREKPAMSAEHNDAMFELGFSLRRQVDPRQFRVRVNAGHLKSQSRSYYIPDVAVLPIALERSQRGRLGGFETYTDPLPLVIEVWSPSTGTYDVDAKIPEYRARGDLEVWRLHLSDRTLIAWRRQPDGSYTETLYRGGTVQPIALPGVIVDLDAVFDEGT